MVRQVRSLAVLLALLAFPLGCGSGLSTEDATLRCDQERDSKNACVDDTAYKACMGCYEECGDECVAHATCPETYSCPE